MLKRILSRRFVSAAAVKTLRENSGAPIAKCKEALNQVGENNFLQAVEWLQARGLSSKISESTASEKVVAFSVGQKCAVGVQLLCVTDFAARSELIKALANKIAQSVQKSSGKIVCEDVLDVVITESPHSQISAGSIRDILRQASAVLGEKVSLGDVKKIHADCVGVYLHDGNGGVGKMGGMVGLELSVEKRGEEDIFKLSAELARQVVACSPRYLKCQGEEILVDEINKIRSEIGDQVDEKIKDRILQGKIKNLREEMVFEDGLFLNGENNKTVGEYISSFGKRFGKIKVVEMAKI